MSFETSNHNETNEAQNNSVNSTNEINQQAKDTIDSVKILDPVKSAEMAASCEAVRLNTAQEHQKIVGNCKMDKIALMQDINLLQQASKESDIPTLESEIETIETRIAELQVDELTREEKRELYKLNNKRDDLRKQVVALENEVQETGDEKVAENTEKVAENTEKVAENTEKVAENTEKVAENTEKVVNILRTMPTDIKDRFPKSIKSILNIEGQEGKVVELLTENKNGELEQILTILKEENVEKYEEFTNSLSNIDDSFAARIKIFEDNYHITKKPENLQDVRSIVSFPEGSQAIDDGNPDTITREKDGMHYEVNSSTGKRTLSKGEHGYRLTEDMPEMPDSVNKIEADFQAKEQEMSGEINSLDQVIEKINTSLQVTGEAFRKFRDSIINMIPSHSPDLRQAVANTNDIQSLQALASSGVLAMKKKELEDDLAIETAEYQKKLKSLIDPIRKQMEKLDERIKDLLEFFDKLGIGRLIPQEVMDYVFAQINGDPGLRQKIGMTEKIDLPNGKIGFDKNPGGGNGLDLLDKKAFVQVVNDMADSELINPDAVNTTSLIPDEVAFKEQLDGAGLLNIGGGAKAIENLRKGDDKESEPVIEENSDESLTG